MSFSWLLFAVTAPIAAAVLSHFLLRQDEPDPVLVIVANGLMPGSGLAIAGRSILEIVLGVLLAQVSMIIVKGPDFGSLLPIAVIGAAWGAVYTPYNPLKTQGTPKYSQQEMASPPPPDPTAPGPRMEKLGGMAHLAGEKDDRENEGYSVSIRCTECGADVSVLVLQRAAQCPYCGSHHLVVGHEDILHVAIPRAVSSDAEIREKLLDHYRYRYYLKLYKKHVAPLEKKATIAGPQGGMAVQQDMALAAELAEKRISSRADLYRTRLSSSLKIRQVQRFWSPYYHVLGTLYQAAFGRDRQSQDKRLLFRLDTLEATMTAQKSLPLPDMGKLSYLKALFQSRSFPTRK